MTLKFLCTCLEEKPCIHMKRYKIYPKFLRNFIEDHFKKEGREEMKKEIEKLIDSITYESVKQKYVYVEELKKQIGKIT